LLVTELRRIGFDNVRLIETEGHPLVYADWLHATNKPGSRGRSSSGGWKPTVLCYGHYDVQPADPLDEWNTPPSSR